MKKRNNDTKIVIGVIATLALVAAIGIASAQNNFSNGMMGGNSGMMGGMMQDSDMMSMMNSMHGMNGSVHDSDDIEWMRQEMKEHMNMTDEEFNEMASHCPMMG